MAGRFSNLEFREEQRPKQELEVKAVASTPPNHLNKAHEEHRWGNYESALRLYTRCLEENRRVIPAWVGQVQMLVLLGEYREARLWADKALELFKGNGDLLAAKGQACVRLRDFGAAYQACDAALQAPGSSPWRWEARGELLLAKNNGQYDTCFRKALAESQADWFDRVVIARMLVFHKRFAAACNYLKEALEREAAYAYGWFELGECQAAMALTGAAETSFQRALELRPGLAVARRALDELDGGSMRSWLGGLIRRWRGK